MKKIGFIIIGILFFSLILCKPSFSVTIDQIAGVWDTWSEAKLRIASVGSFVDANPSETTLTLGGNFSLYEDSSGGPYTYTGTFILVDGKKLSITFDTNGVNELKDTWTNWAMEIAEDVVSVSNIAFEIESLTVSKPAINKKTLVPKKTTVKAKGWVSAEVNGEPLRKRFTYTSKVTFVGR